MMVSTMTNVTVLSISVSYSVAAQAWLGGKPELHLISVKYSVHLRSPAARRLSTPTCNVCSSSTNMTDIDSKSKSVADTLSSAIAQLEEEAALKKVSHPGGKIECRGR